jgi:4-amino-4-deoxychorismate lyase
MTHNIPPVQSCVNGELTDQLNIFDRGLAYGDGLFETMRVESGRVLLWDAHLTRLLSSCERLGIPAEGLIERVSNDIQLLLSTTSVPSVSVLKLIVTRGAGQRGYAPSSGQAPTVIVSLAPYTEQLDKVQSGVRLRWCDMRLSVNPTLAGMKHLNRLEQVLARGEWTTTEVAEGIMCDPDGHVVEGTMSNLFWVSNGELFTPDLTRCGIEGVLRNTLLACAERAGIKTHIQEFQPDSLLNASEVFICNSLINIWPVVALENASWPIGTVTQQLERLLKKEYAV